MSIGPLPILAGNASAGDQGMRASATTSGTSLGPTPVLDRLAPLPPPVSPGTASRAIVGGALGLMVAIAAILAIWDPPFLQSLRWRIVQQVEQMSEGAGPLLLAGSVVVAAIACVVVHETGHVLGGVLAGFRFHSMAIGPLKLERGFRLSRHRGALAWSGGWVGMVPGRLDRLRLRTLILVAAGPVASLLWGAVVLLLPFSKGPASTTFIAASLLGGVIELLPVRVGAVAFDGWRIWNLLRRSPWGERWLALTRLSAEIQDGVMPEALSAEALANAVALRDGSIDTVTAHGTAYFAALHQHRDAEAGELLETCLRYASHAPPAVREALMSDAGVFQARRRQRPDLAEQWLADLTSTTSRAWLRTRVEAAILAERGEVDAASRKLDQYEDALRSLPLPSEAQRDMLLRLVRRWRDELSGPG
jgi:hypothetical protein